uniref:Uncharacterized protein LOC111119971 isoform X1 n=2 Tax=Crassostrea virginica TaxID=6565 RepID=A0A8B8CKA9_CRAVI|nr:uncharacterized protein LOC111119971 isoform X1 [Crassostrea virginica]
MFLSSVLTLAVSVALSRAAAAPPAPCCIAQQFSANIDETGGQVDGTGGKFMDQMMFVQTDYPNKVTYVEGTVTRPTGTYLYRLVNDYTENMSYSFVSGACYKVGAPTFPLQDQCLLSNATYVGTSKLGSPSLNIPVNTYQVDLGGIDVKAVVSADGSCTPIMESLAGTIGGTPQQLTLFFYNYQPSLSRPDVFKFDRSTCVSIPSTPTPG